jgi:hypothetical protein
MLRIGLFHHHGKSMNSGLRLPQELGRHRLCALRPGGEHCANHLPLIGDSSPIHGNEPIAIH